MFDALFKGAGMVMDYFGKNRDRDTLIRNAEMNRMQQEQFAKEGIRWKVADAKAAGIHPLFALGASTTSFAPVSVGSLPEHTATADMGSMGQDISRAIDATRTSGERKDAIASTVEALQIKRMGLENDLLASQIRKINQAGQPPAFPGMIDPDPKTPSKMPRLQVGGVPITTDPYTSNQEDFEKRYGDDGPVSWLTQAGVALRDLQASMGGMSIGEILRRIDRATALDNLSLTRRRGSSSIRGPR